MLGRDSKCLRDEPLTIWGGGLGQKREKNYCPLCREKKNATATCVGKKTQLNNLEERKNQLNNLEGNEYGSNAFELKN